MLASPSRHLQTFAHLVRTEQVTPGTGALRLGVDLGTANIVLGVVDDAGAPVAGAWRRATVVRDGVVVDWLGAVRVVGALKATLEERVGTRFERATVAAPPGIDAGTAKVFGNVLESCGMHTTEIVNEPVAAATALGVRDGTVIDVGHGTTGVSLLRGGQVEFSIDEATGGHHMTLVISGALGMGYDEAEDFKRDPDNAELVFGLIRPTLEKMATIARDALRGAGDPGTIHLVGGSSSFPRAAEVFVDVLGHDVVRSVEPLFPTPLGTAMRRTP
ncbi:ethanolamine utilization protein EutJ [Tessaracoccus sp. MC1679]|uniref:ethanolamine utilization protein EutJ n=1 Tax=Tessaracoccus sp. MC1679 TaxID=2760313 RepID=UPI001602CAE5|nr:ethanolamine utilization protein EutJ [Tessaracoccus sp. MC1679]MBB1515910.1 ethanolamine utilization protein EutJ [Tessaracoccus sp. MC1679]